MKKTDSAIPAFSGLLTIVISQLLIACSPEVPGTEQLLESTSSASGANSVAYPTGSYTLTCSNIVVNDDALSGNCAKFDGSIQQSTMANLALCLNSIRDNGDIGNIDGNVLCIPDIPKPDPTFYFPRAESSLNQLIYSGDLSAIHGHAWGIWAGLMQTMGRVDGVPVRAFETWSTTGNMLYRMERGTAVETLNAPMSRPRLELDIPRQFKNIRALGGDLLEAVSAAKAEDGDTNIFVSVAYNPPAAKHAIANKLFLQSTLNEYLANGYREIPNFPPNAITIKPVYKVIPKDTPGGIYTFPGWPGTPLPAKTFPESDWNSCVYIDINGSGAGGSAIDPDCSGPSPSTTFFINNFVHQTVSAADALYLRSQLNVNVSAGGTMSFWSGCMLLHGKSSAGLGRRFGGRRAPINQNRRAMRILRHNGPHNTLMKRRITTL